MKRYILIFVVLCSCTPFQESELGSDAQLSDASENRDAVVQDNGFQEDAFVCYCINPDDVRTQFANIDCVPGTVSWGCMQNPETYSPPYVKGASCYTLEFVHNCAKPVALDPFCSCCGDLTFELVDDDFTVCKNQAKLIDVFDNDSMVELHNLRWSDPPHGRVDNAGPMLWYWPDNEFQGDDTFTYQGDNGCSTRDSALVTIHVVSCEDAG